VKQEKSLSKAGSRAYIDINELKKEEAAVHLQGLGKYQTGSGGKHIPLGVDPKGRDSRLILESISPESSSPSPSPPHHHPNHPNNTNHNNTNHRASTISK
jgi:hypothetical protein